jgi:DNA polymerase-3 subunit beta
MRGVIIPKDAAVAALKILPDSEVECELACNDRLMRLRVGEVELVSKLIEGTYPDWPRIMPQGGAGRVITPREALAEAAARVGVVLEEKGRAIRIRFAAEAIELAAQSPDGGNSAREQVGDCVSDAGEIEIGVNPRYLADILDAMDGAQLAIVLQGDAGSPLLFEEVDGDGSLRMVLMPMRIDAAGAESSDKAKKKAA